MTELQKQIKSALERVRDTSPLVHHITNYVTVNDCANVTLAIGASPIMADDIGEAADIASISSSLVLNIGTLNTRTVESMLLAGKAANKAGVPVVLDPVGAGASALRNETLKKLLDEVKMTLIRGNVSEISYLAGISSSVRGVDASEEDIKKNKKELAAAAALKYGCTVAVTGAVDVVCDGERWAFLSNGTPSLSRVTGTGCMSTSLCGAFCGAKIDPFVAATGALCAMGIAGELADEAGPMGTSSFRTGVIDALSLLTGEALAKRAKIHEE
ncbi:MAG: hydroxyethylthiazole kinase [Clostridia bacterium]|nr:hydroxyethylthiazole kinase [Clostridia bacterium]